MSSEIVDLTAHRGGGALLEPLEHPAGVKLPFEGPSDAALIIPEIRSDLRSGAYSSEMIALLGQAVELGDRVLVIGAGLGVVSSLVARREGVARVIAIEANTTLMPYLKRVHEMNGVPGVETVNAVLAENKQGRVPFFARRDLRMSSLLPHDRSWQQVMMVPFMNLNLILEEERISLVVCDIPVAAAQLVAEADLSAVDRVLMNCSDEPSACWDEGGACALLIQRGFVPEPAGGAVLFRRVAKAKKPDSGSVLDDTASAAVDKPVDRLADQPADPANDDLAGDDLAGDGLASDGLASDGLANDGLASDDLTSDDLAGDDLDDDDLTDEDDLREEEDSVDPSLDTGGVPEASSEALGTPEDAADGADDRPDLDQDEAAARDIPASDLEPVSVAPGPAASREAVSREAASGATPGTKDATWSQSVRDHFSSLFADAPANGAEPPDQRPDPGAPGTAAPASEPEPEAQPGSAARDGLLARLWALALLALTLALPLILVGEFAGDRAERHASATAQTVAVWGGPQTLTGPFLVVPVNGGGAPAAPLVILPDRLGVSSTLSARLRHEDIFGLPVYRGRHEVEIAFAPGQFADLQVGALLSAGETLDWDRATLGLGLSESKGLKDVPVLSAGNAALPFEAGSGIPRLAGIQAPIGDPRGTDGRWHLGFDLAGSGGFRLTPAARITEGQIDASWSGAGDTIGARTVGAFQPEAAQGGGMGLATRWSVPHLAHALPLAFRGSDGLEALRGADFGIVFTTPADLFAGIQRAAKFGFLMLIASFLVLLALERTTGRRPHLVQYALIGAAQCLFFLLLLPLTEVLGLTAAFLLSAGATVILLTAYAWAGIGMVERSLWLTAALIGLYGVMYLVLHGTDMLLTGAVVAFVALGAAMWLTRGDPSMGAAGWPRFLKGGSAGDGIRSDPTRAS